MADYGPFARLFPELAIVDPLPSPAEFAAAIAPRMVVAVEGGDVVGYSFWRLGTLRAYAQKDALHVFAEGDDKLAAFLISPGAHVRDELFRMGRALAVDAAASNDSSR